MEYQPRSNEKYDTFLYCISCFEGTSFYDNSLKTPYPRLTGQIFLSVIFLSFGSFHLVYLLGAHMKLNGQKRLNEMEEEF